MHSAATTSKSLVLAFLLSFTALGSFALANPTKHIITFTFPTYTPSTLNVAVGDTIEWTGSFSGHPLASTSVPAGAATFSNSTGSKFDYVVTTAGSYQYWCVFHGASAGMKGSFTAATSSVAPSANQPAFELLQNAPNPAGKLTALSFQLRDAASVTLRVIDTKGAILATVLDSKQSAGKHTLPFDVSSLPSGAYFVQLTSNGAVATKQMIVQH